MSREIPRVPIAVPVAALAAFGALLGLTLADWAPLRRFDTITSQAMRGYGDAHPDLVAALRVVTDVAATIPFLGIGIAATALFAGLGRRRQAAFCAVVTAAVPILWSVLHWQVHSPRPADGFVTIDSSGFPSGHTSHAAAIAFAAVLLAWPHTGGRAHVALTTGAAAFALFIAYTRVALLAHWATDVIGGLLLSAAIVPLAALATARVAGARCQGVKRGPFLKQGGWRGRASGRRGSGRL